MLEVLGHITMDIISIFLSARYILLLVVFPLIGYRILQCFLGKTPKNLPPGPREWGTSWKVMKAMWNGTLPWLATEWARKYGPITFLYSLGQPLVFLNSTEVVRKLCSSEEYKFLVADRQPTTATRIAEFNGKDLFFSKFDTLMKKKRRLFFNVLGLYGDGVAQFENVVWEEMERLFAELDRSEGQDIELTKRLARSVKIIIYILATGELPADPSVPEILEEYDLAFNRLCSLDVDFVLGYLPFVARIPGRFRNAVQRLKAAKKSADEFMYYRPKRTHVLDQPRGITDLLLDFQKKPGNEWMEEDDIISFITVLFFGAYLSSRASLAGVFLCLLNYPHLIRKIQEEIDHVIGNERPKPEHRSSMPYTEATVLETLRIIAQVPLQGYRRASEDISFDGITIPKDSLILMNSFFYLHDDNVWEDPWRFNPERFLDDDGNLLPTSHQRRRDLITFGVGVRACPGEGFARSRVFHFLTSILQRYDIHPPATEKLTPADFQNNLGGDLGLVCHPPPFKCRLLRRQRCSTYH